MSQALTDKSCTTCQKAVSALINPNSQKLLKDFGNQRVLNKKDHLYRKYIFKNFRDAWEFGNQIAKLSEQEKHHPLITIGCGICSLEIWTHKINELTENNFILASKIQELYLKKNQKVG